MKKERKWLKIKNVPMPIAALIDVVFLMLIFFLLTYHPSLVEAFASVKHPRCGTTRLAVPLDIAIRPGEYRLEDRVMPLSAIEGWLLRCRVVNADTTIAIKVSREATEGELVAVLDMCHKLQLHNLNVMTLKE